MTDVRTAQSVKELTTAIASGDTEAFGRFYDAWFDRVLIEARRVTSRDESFCLDIVQDTMMKVIKSLKPLPNEAALFNWMRLVVRSCAYDRLRRDARRLERELTVSTETRPEPVDLTEQLQWLQGQIAELDDRDARLLMMRHRFGWTLEKIGRTLGIGHNVADRRLKKVVRSLKQKAKEEFDGLSTL